MTDQYSLSVLDHTLTSTWHTYLDPTQQRQVIKQLFQYVINCGRREDLRILDSAFEIDGIDAYYEEDSDSQYQTPTLCDPRSITEI